MAGIEDLFPNVVVGSIFNFKCKYDDCKHRKLCMWATEDAKNEPNLDLELEFGTGGIHCQTKDTGKWCYNPHICEETKS